MTFTGSTTSLPTERDVFQQLEVDAHEYRDRQRHNWRLYVFYETVDKRFSAFQRALTIGPNMLVTGALTVRNNESK